MHKYRPPDPPTSRKELALWCEWQAEDLAPYVGKPAFSFAEIWDDAIEYANDVCGVAFVETFGSTRPVSQEGVLLRLKKLRAYCQAKRPLLEEPGEDGPAGDGRHFFYRGARVGPLERKPYALLELLWNEFPYPVQYDTIHNIVWGTNLVGDYSITSATYKIRTAFLRAKLPVTCTAKNQRVTLDIPDSWRIHGLYD